MNDNPTLVDQSFEWVSQLTGKFNQLRELLKGRELSAVIVQQINMLTRHLNDGTQLNGETDTRLLSQKFDLICIGALDLCHSLVEAPFAQVLSEPIAELNDIANQLRALTNQIKVPFITETHQTGLADKVHHLPTEGESTPQKGLTSDIESQLSEILSKTEKRIAGLENLYLSKEQQLESKKQQVERKMVAVTDSVDLEQGKMIERFDQMMEKIDDVEQQLQKKLNDIEEVFGIVTGAAIAGNFDNVAEQEKRVADRLRMASIVIMALSAVIIGYSIWETTQAHFSWQTGIFRIVLVFLLSMPAAYMARESSKHREQHYNYHQTSLDLKAIDPYSASLPQEFRHQLKMEIAKRIFSANDRAKGPGGFPVNSHDVASSILEMLDAKGAGAKKPPCESQPTPHNRRFF